MTVDIVKTVAFLLSVTVPLFATIHWFAIRKVTRRIDADRRDAALQILEQSGLPNETKAVVVKAFK